VRKLPENFALRSALLRLPGTECRADRLHLLAALFESLARVFFEGIRMVGSKGLSSVPSCPFSSDKPRDTSRVQFSKWMD
jgi:hypothetical protein